MSFRLCSSQKLAYRAALRIVCVDDLLLDALA
jgi:hypothetical protein